MDGLGRAAELGIETSFVDATGHPRAIDEPTLAQLLEAIPSAAPHDILTEPVICRGDAVPEVEARGEAQPPLRWRLMRDGAMIADGVAEERRVALPRPPDGVCTLCVTDAAGRHDAVNLLTVPQRAFGGAFHRGWLLAVQLYGIRSRRNWGIGDFTDLAALVAWAAACGAAGIGLNPLHALFADHPRDCSPYAPNSRLFLNPLYIDVAALPELPADFIDTHAAAIEAARDAVLVDYAAVAELKLAGLRAAFDAFRTSASPERRADFEDFRHARGETLSRFACFEALRARLKGPWWEWPQPWTSPDEAALDALRQGADAAGIAFVAFVQWCADRQLAACRDRAAALNLSVGLYLDVAVGVKADGFDAWHEQAAISRHLSVGAPPDLLNTAGQNWGLAGFNAPGLEATSYRPFREMLRAAMHYAGAIRLDHALGLQRLYLVPAGRRPDEGAYVRMPLEPLLALAALESAQHRCIVIGEDLGTVPDGFRDRLRDWGLWSYRVMMFERGHDGAFLPPQDYTPDALVTFSTHDLATYEGWRTGHDIALKQGLGIDPGESREARAQAVTMLARAVDGDGGIDAVLGYLARARSRLLCVGIEDLLGLVDQANVPGTIDEHPNWRRRLPVALEDWPQHIDTARLRAAMGDRNA
jgi:4-alpha-glucanotransferase